MDLLSKHGIGGGGGSNIKSIQRGTATFDYTSGTLLNISISSINPNKSIVRITYNRNSENGAQPAFFDIACKIVDATNIQLIRQSVGNSSVTDIIVNWEVIEFNNVKSKQTGVVNGMSSNSNTDVEITSINTNKSLLLFNHTHNTDNIGYSSLANYIFIRGSIYNSTTLRFYILALTPTIYWQVIEFN